MSGNRGTIDPVDRSYGCVPNHTGAICELAPSFGLDRALERLLIWAANFYSLTKNKNRTKKNKTSSFPRNFLSALKSVDKRFSEAVSAPLYNSTEWAQWKYSASNFRHGKMKA